MHPNDRVCPSCGNVLSIFRLNAHRKSAACKVYAAEKKAVQDLAEVGGYTRIARSPTLIVPSLAGRRPMRMLAVGHGDLGDVTVVLALGTVLQLFEGEYEVRDGGYCDAVRSAPTPPRAAASARAASARHRRRGVRPTVRARGCGARGRVWTRPR